MPDTVYRFDLDTCQHLERVLGTALAHHSARGALLVTHDPDAAITAARELGRVRQVPVYLLSMAGRRMARPGAAGLDLLAGPAADPVDVVRAGGEVDGGALIVYQDML